MGLLAENGPEWVAVDLAVQRAGMVFVPLPGFFTLTQSTHAVAATGMDRLFCDAPAVARALGFEPAGDLDGLPWYRRTARERTAPSPASKVTFTSGTTGAPKGVPLTAAQQWAVAGSLAEAARAVGIRRHLCLLPLAILLENVAGVYATQCAGAQCWLPPLAETGVRGASGFDAGACLAAIEACEAHSVIVLPQMLLALTSTLEGGARRPVSLRFVAVGGAKVSPALLARARRAGLPVYEGYGLSECASVVALNLPGADRAGSVGRPLPHAKVEIRNHEIFVDSGSGYLATGDLGRLDEAGFLYIEGRRKHLLITSYGRNVSPEWPESELLAGNAIAQAAVFGEARPQLCALLVPAASDVTDASLAAQVEAANARLPEYARIGRWLRAETPFTPRNGFATANGRLRRDALWEAYGARLDALF